MKRLALAILATAIGLCANAQQQTSVEKLVDAMPEIIDKVKEVLSKKKDEETDTEV